MLTPQERENLAILCDEIISAKVALKKADARSQARRDAALAEGRDPTDEAGDVERRELGRATKAAQQAFDLAMYAAVQERLENG